MKQESIQEQQLRQRYKNSFVQKAGQIDILLGRMAEDRSKSDSPLEDIHEYLHKLAGSSGMYGFLDIAELARTAMREFDQDIPWDGSGRLKARLKDIRDLLEQYA